MSAVLPEFTDFAHSLADGAGNIIRPLFRQAVSVDAKEDRSPVTAADREAERFMRETIMKRYPDHGIWGEEWGRHLPNAKYCWLLDPVDGTKSFISGFPTFAILVSLTRLGVPVLGLIDQPVTRERWVGISDFPSTFNGRSIVTKQCASLASATLSTTSPYLFNNTDKPLFKQIKDKIRFTVYGYDSYAYAQLASGNIDLVLEAGLKPHDFCALRPVVEGAGGIITDWQGKPLTLASDGRVIAAGDKRIHSEALGLLQHELSAI